MADITPVKPLITGIATGSAAASAGGDAVLNNRGNVILRVTNANGSSVNVTLAAQQTARGTDGNFPPMTLANAVIAVPNATSRLIGPIPPAFNDGNNKVQVTYSASSGVTIEAIDPS